MNRADEIVRPPLDVDIDPADVLPQYADIDQLNAPKKQNSHDQSGVARQIDTENQGAQHYQGGIDKAQE